MELDEELLQGFIEEAKDNLEKVALDLEGYVQATDQVERLDAMYRGIHTIKGGSSMFGMEELRKLAHSLETSLGGFRDAPEKLNENVVKKYQQVLIRLEDLLDESLTPVTHSDQVTSDELQSQSQPQSQKRKTSLEVIRVPIDRVQQNHDIVSELFLIRNQLAHLMEQEGQAAGIKEDFIMKWELLDNSLRQRIIELENVVLNMRMMPVKNLFSRMTKTVNAYCESSEKKIIVNVIGEETELDKKILDSLADPLVHLIRNSMDHGIELPQDRLSKGKLESGHINLNAKVSGNEAVLEISDDGNGINPDRIIEAAKKKGIDTSHVKNDDDAVQLIFAPGFSTAEEVTDVSGRGVGMDAVKTYVEESGGKIKVSTKRGEGTQFKLYLPIGLSVIPAIIVRVGDHLYGIPTHDIASTLSMTRKDISNVEGKPFLNLENEYIPCFFLGDLFDDTKYCDDQINKSISVCVFESTNGRVAFVVDDVEANAELITKPIPSHSPQFEYLSGVSLLATGEPAFVLSLENLFYYVDSLKNEGDSIAA